MSFKLQFVVVAAKSDKLKVVGHQTKTTLRCRTFADRERNNQFVGRV